MDHYLDDFVVVGPPKSRVYSRFLQTALRVCGDSGLPLAGEKTVGPATLIPLLGIELDSEQLVVRPGRRFLRGVFGLMSQFRKPDNMMQHSGRTGVVA